VGHQSLVVDTPDGTAVVAVDAVPCLGTLRRPADSDRVPVHVADDAGASPEPTLPETATATDTDTDDAAGPRFRMGGAVDEPAWWDSAHGVCDQAHQLYPGHEWAVVPESPADVG
jgi:hypothetical protein